MPVAENPERPTPLHAPPLPDPGGLLAGLRADRERRDLRVRKRDYLLPFLIVVALLIPFDITVEKKTEYGLQRLDRLRQGNTVLDMRFRPRVDTAPVLAELEIPREQVAASQFVVESYLNELDSSILIDWGRLVSFTVGDLEYHFGLPLFRDMTFALLMAGLLWARKRRRLAEDVIQQEKAQFERLSTELENRVQESARIIDKLNTLQDKLVTAEKLASIGRLSATLAHEIRNPLSIIKSSTEIIETDLPGAGPSHSALGLIRDEITRLDRIISDLLYFARPKEAVVAVHRVSALLRPWLPPVVEELEKDNIQMVPQFENEDGDVAVDADQLYQVFLNVMWNARDALRGAHNPHVFVRLEDGGPEYIHIVIKDTGMGMIPDVLRQITEPFYTTKTQGTGLGLPVSVQLMEGMGGRLVIESELDFGTTVKLYLPRAGVTRRQSPSGELVTVRAPKRGNAGDSAHSGAGG